MADPLATADEAELAGYIDSGIWMMEEYLADIAGQRNIRDMHFRQLWQDYFGPRS